jgi:phosphoheptose isomerase
MTRVEVSTRRMTHGLSVLTIAEGRLTQLIALTGSDGGRRKTIIDRAIAFVPFVADHVI